MSLLEDLKSRVLNSNTIKALTGQDYLQSTPGKNFIPEATVHDGQKRFSTNEAIPNLPKPSTHFFVQFNINPRASELIQKKRKIIEYLSNVYTNPTELENNFKNNKDKSDSALQKAFNALTSPVSQVLSDVANSVSSVVNNSSSKEKSQASSNNKKMIADYLMDADVLTKMGLELSALVKSIDKPSVSFDVKRYNQYNHTKLVQGKASYGDISITFFDVKENPVQQFFFTYLKLINNDFLCKNDGNFRQNVNNRKISSDPTSWGLNVDSSFRLITSISIIEMYMDKIMVYTIENPMMTSISFGKNTLGDYASQDITVKFAHEGITNDLLVGETPSNIEAFSPGSCELNVSNDPSYLKAMINKPINGDIATAIQKRYKNGSARAVDTVTSFIKGIMDTNKSDRNAKIKTQLLDTAKTLGFANDINMIQRFEQNISAYKDADNKGKFLLKTIDDPTSAIGQITQSTAPSSASNLTNISNL